MADNIFIFNPEGVRIGEYRSKYPELKSIKEFQPLSDFELVFIWYYINPTSYYVYRYPGKLERLQAICEKLYTDQDVARQFIDKFMSRTLLNQEEWDMAIDRMAKVVPDARVKAKEMIDKMFEDYKTLLDLPLSDFVSGGMLDKERNWVGGKTDYSQYLAVRKQITKDLEEIISKVECGFGINRVGEITTDGQSIMDEYHKNKMNLSEQS